MNATEITSLNVNTVPLADRVQLMLRAQERAKELADAVAKSAAVPETNPEVEARKLELEGMSQEELVTLVLSLEFKTDKRRGSGVGEAVVAIFQDPDCKFLTAREVANIVRASLHSNTTPESVSCYPTRDKRLTDGSYVPRVRLF